MKLFYSSEESRKLPIAVGDEVSGGTFIADDFILTLSSVPFIANSKVSKVFISSREFHQNDGLLKLRAHYELVRLLHPSSSIRSELCQSSSRSTIRRRQERSRLLWGRLGLGLIVSVSLDPRFFRFYEYCAAPPADLEEEEDDEVLDLE
ncbi:hypothetical protein L3Y34_004428 [Caenorhabditis briggsae]|uniref:Uncharacterized protein n=1 Tax=Caenorhabditis briggsae TaxID=6238 RepID=A0AAE9D6G7_CAEBR|nr:hypothetical protein L3Y34_004428 [Caenorhabditis briggsae]